jgi:ABC-type bacteriocin/lantibiotic exporter with double-glycine peptidase domain
LFRDNGNLSSFVKTKDSSDFRKAYLTKSLYEIDSMESKAGAFGNWERRKHKKDPSIVQQTSGTSCVSAVGEMLLRERGINNITQEQILAEIGEPSDVVSLARCLNRFDKSDDGLIWHGIAIPPEQLDAALSKGSIGAFLINDYRDRLLHAVLVKGIDDNDLIKINDTFDQTSYIMTREDFLNHWGGQIVFRWYP